MCLLSISTPSEEQSRKSQIANSQSKGDARIADPRVTPNGSRSAFSQEYLCHPFTIGGPSLELVLFVTAASVSGA
jgi:hypothetical protein